jgi:hypothetical protein
MKTAHWKRFTAIAGLVLSLTTLNGASPAPTPAAPAPVESPATAKSEQPAASAVKVTLLSFTPMVGMPGSADFKIATLTFKIEASSPVTVTDASFYVDSAPVDDGSGHTAPLTLLIHT